MMLEGGSGYLLQYAFNILRCLVLAIVSRYLDMGVANIKVFCYVHAYISLQLTFFVICSIIA